jgi:hypothetical protein
VSVWVSQCWFGAGSVGLCWSWFVCANQHSKRTDTSNSTSTMPQLQAGIGAKGSILTRFIKPTQVLPDGDRSHRSNIIIQSWYANKTGSVYYEFQHEGAGPNAQLMYGAARLVKIHEEGPGVFTGQPPQRVPEAAEPRVPWRNSKARKLLYADVQADVASEELTACRSLSLRTCSSSPCRCLPWRLHSFRHTQ